MKKILLITVFAFSAIFANAQKYAYVDSDYILDQIPEYHEAQKQLNEFSEQWEKIIEEKYKEIDQLYKSYQAESALLPDDLKRKREEEIIQKEDEAKKFQKDKFGVNGQLFQKRKELIEPIQDKIFKAIQEIAQTGSYGFVFDKANQSNLIYADKKYNKSDAVLKKLGIRPGSDNN